jgi:NitT/TauT family transport system ATP-binding protein
MPTRTANPGQVASPAIAVSHLGMTYPNGLESLRGVDLNVAPGDFVSIVGPSGCGKSTLLRLIAGLAEPTTGSALVCGLPPDKARREKEIGFVFQSPALLPWRDAVGNAALPLEIRGVARSERREKAREALARVGLSGFESAFPRELSGGMRMRAAIARALVVKPDLLLMDEPFGALDELTREKLNEELSDLWTREKGTILFVTHNVYEAAFMSRRVIVMNKRPGRITGDVAIPFAYPRDRNLRATPEFAALTGEIRALLAKAAS